MKTYLRDNRRMQCYIYSNQTVMKKWQYWQNNRKPLNLTPFWGGKDEFIVKCPAHVQTYRLCFIYSRHPSPPRQLITLWPLFKSPESIHCGHNAAASKRNRTSNLTSSSADYIHVLIHASEIGEVPQPWTQRQWPHLSFYQIVFLDNVAWIDSRRITSAIDANVYSYDVFSFT